MRNLEIKVRVDRLEDIRSLLGFAEYKEVLGQVDTYFLLGDARLKVREEGRKNEVIWYARKMIQGTRESVYHVVTLPLLLVSLVKFLLRAVFGIKVVVKKQRELFLYKNTRIHVDTVAGLGSFVELETVVRDETKGDTYSKEHEEVKERLTLRKYQAIPGSYSDLLSK